MGRSGHRVEPWHRERRITALLDAVALLARAVAAEAGITLADLDDRPVPTACDLRHQGLDQRWRGAPELVQLSA